MGPPAQRPGWGRAVLPFEAPPPPARSSASPPSTVGREQVAEIQGRQDSEQTGKEWDPSSEKGGLTPGWSEPGFWAVAPRPPALSRTPQHRLSPETPQVKTASGPGTTAASALFPAGAGALCEATRRNKAASPAGLRARPAAAAQPLHVYVFPPQTSVTGSVGMA